MKINDISIEERKRLLAIPNWSYKEVMQYTGWKKSKCFQVMKTCKEKLNGRVLFNDHCVSRNSVLAFLGTSLECECYAIKQLEKEEATMPVKN